jgi:hypothetical protein
VKNANNADNADKVDGFHASLTPAPNVIVPLNSAGILDLSATYVKSNVYTFRRVDLTNATSDYMLQVGEEAIINFTNATSVPLRIATQSGTYYEVKVVSSVAINATQYSIDFNFLCPNNMTYSNAFMYVHILRGSVGFFSGYLFTSAFPVGWRYADVVFYITNFTQHKELKGICNVYENSDGYACTANFSSMWLNTTTSWTSLGTFVFANPFSGYILIRRLV